MSILSNRGVLAIGILALLSCATSCSMFSPSNVPVDCNVVLTQEQAGVDDTKIAADLGSTVDKVAACHGQKQEYTGQNRPF